MKDQEKQEGGETLKDDNTPYRPSRPVADFYRVQPVVDRRIHILGLGSVGRFVAHALRGIPNPPPVTLLFHRYKRFEEWDNSSRLLNLRTGEYTEKRGGFGAELITPRPRQHGKELPFEKDIGWEEPSDPIHSLILTVKAPDVISALSGVRHRLGPESVILFMQNGMGVIDEVNEEIFPDPERRPHYMLGINTHGVTIPNKEPFSAIHAGFGQISLGLVPHERTPHAPNAVFNPFDKEPYTSKNQPNPDPDTAPPGDQGLHWNRNSRYLLRTLLRTPVLCAAGFSPLDILQLQLEKLAINSVINPMTVLLDARNGSILYNFHLTRVIRLLISEISLVIRSLPELQHIPNVSTRFDPGRLESLVVGVARRTSENISSMLMDMRSGRRTEIDYINGWVVKRGEDMGVRCVMNYMTVQLVKGKTTMINWEMHGEVPFVDERLLSGDKDDGV
jgi:2-dehydropantoate 2-reductase